jgi:integrase
MTDMTSNHPKTTGRTVPIKETITKIGGGYPDKLIIFKIPSSKYWWVRYYTEGKVLKKSTKLEDKRKSLEFGKKFYEDILLRQRNLLPLGNSPSFERVSRELLIEQSQLIERGERSSKLNINDKQKLEKDILPYFKGMNVKDVTYKHLDNYITTLRQRKLKPPTINNHLSLIHKILSLSERENLIDRLPTFPRVKRKDSPRGWFNNDEYKLLLKTVKEVIQDKTVVRSHQITDEMRLLITFMVNSFLRPSDVKNLKHRNIQVIEKEHTYLRIQTDESKTVNTPIVTMESCVGIYKDLLEFQKENNRPHGKDDYVFFPHLKGQGKDTKTKKRNPDKEENRDFALQTMRRQFDYILNKCDLKTTPNSEPRTLYSLRHTCIMFRLTMGESIDLLTLSRNCRTSVGMIERFYGKPLEGEMNIGKIQSTRFKTS